MNQSVKKELAGLLLTIEVFSQQQQPAKRLMKQKRKSKKSTKCYYSPSTLTHEQ